MSIRGAVSSVSNFPMGKNSDLYAKTPAHNLVFSPRLVERSNMIKLTHLSKDEILERLEQERFERLHKAASNLKALMLRDDRCPLCTLSIPCKHFESQEQLYN